MSDYESEERDLSRSRGSKSRSRSRSGSNSGARSDRSRYSRSQSRSRTRSRSPRTRSRSPEGKKETSSVGKVQLCSVHQVDLRPDTCNGCYTISKMVKPHVLKEIIKARANGDGPEDAEVPSAAARFSRSDEKPPTLTLSPPCMDLASKIFSLGKFKVSHHFEELTKEFLFLPVGQNELLNANLSMENMFKQHEKSGKFKHVFTFKNQVVKVTRDLRVAQRPLFLATAELDKVLNQTRTLGKALGFKYPAEIPKVEILGPKKHPNHLSYTCLPSFELPHIMDILEGTRGVSVDDADIIRKNQLVNTQALEGYRRDMIDKVAKLYDNMAAGIVGVDAMINFYFELYGHCDGSLRDLVRSKLSNLFVPAIRNEARGTGLTRSERDVLEESSTGLFGGDSSLRDRVDAATKSDDLVKKVMIKPRDDRREKRRNRHEKVSVSKDGNIRFSFLSLLSYLFLREV